MVLHLPSCAARLSTSQSLCISLCLFQPSLVALFLSIKIFFLKKGKSTFFRYDTATDAPPCIEQVSPILSVRSYQISFRSVVEFASFSLVAAPLRCTLYITMEHGVAKSSSLGRGEAKVGDLTRVGGFKSSPLMSRLLEPSEGSGASSSLMKRLDAFLPAMEKANREIKETDRLDDNLVHVGGDSEEPASSDGEEKEKKEGAASDEEGEGPMIELNVALGDFEDSLYAKLEEGGGGNPDPSPSPGPSGARPETVVETFVAKEMSKKKRSSSDAPDCEEEEDQERTTQAAKKGKKTSLIEVIE